LGPRLWKPCIAAAAFAGPAATCRRAPTAPIRGIDDADGRRMVVAGGGMPILPDGMLVAACGVGGATD
jgi:uncharacterized protein GlcG (DUF336 family)